MFYDYNENIHGGIKMKRIIKEFFTVILLTVFINCYSNKRYYEHSWLNYPSEPINNNIGFDEFTKKEYEGKYISIWQYNINAEIINVEYKSKYITLLYENEFIEIT
jgi:hypothetical protein